jgi:hypothetical protein
LEKLESGKMNVDFVLEGVPFKGKLSKNVKIKK